MDTNIFHRRLTVIKKTIVLTTILLLSMSVVATAASSGAFTGSFRLTNSGNLLWGDFDNDLDPIYIWDNDGYRVYSTLSNLSSNSNYYLDDNGDGVYLFGGSGDFGLPTPAGWENRLAFVVQLADSRSYNNSGLDLNYDGDDNDAGESGWGDVSGDRTQYSNWSGSQYDTRDNYTATGNSFDIRNNRDWHLTNSYRKGTDRVGFSFTHLGFGDNAREDNRVTSLIYGYDESYSYSKTNMTYDVSAGAPVLSQDRNRSGDYSDRSENPANLFTLSFERENFRPNWDIRFDLMYEKFTDTRVVADVHSEYMADFTLGVTSNTSINEVYNMDEKGDGSLIMPGLQLTRHWNPDTYSWFRLDFGFGSQDVNDSWTRAYDVMTVDDQQITVTNWDQSMISEGDASLKVLHFFHKTVAELTPLFTVAAGLDYSKVTDDADDLSYTSTTTIEDSDIDGAGLLITDWRRSASTVEVGTANAKTTTKTVTLPVAMELTKKRWTFRLGAVHTISTWTSDTSFTQTALAAFSDTTTYGDGSGSLQAAPPNTFGSFSQTREQKWHGNSFYYGVKLEANDNLIIEIMDFFSSGEKFNDSDWFRELSLSFTLLL